MRGLLLSASVVALLGVSPTSAAFAQGGDTNGDKDQTAATKPVIEEVIVTAQHRKEREHDVPLTITAITGADLGRAGISDTRQLQMAVPGLSFTTQGTWAEPSIRGVSTSLSQGGAESPIALYVDGVYQPNQIANLFDLPDIQRIEVLKGPQGTLFGRNATGGAIVIHTLNPSFTPDGYVSVEDGVYAGNNVHTSNSFTAKAYISGPLVNDKLAGSFSAYDNWDEGYLTNDKTGKGYGRVESYMFRGKLLFQPTENMSFQLTAMYARTLDDTASSLQPLNGVTTASFYPDAIVPTQPWHTAGEMNGGSHVSVNYYMVSLESNLDFPGIGSAKSTTAYNWVHPIALVDVDAAYSPQCMAAFGCITPYVVNYGPEGSFQQEVDFTSEQFGPFSFTAGLFYWHDLANIIANVGAPLASNGTVNINAPGFFQSYAQIKTNTLAAYGELYWNITHNLRAIAGLRYSYESKRGVGSFFGGPEFRFGGNPNWYSMTPRFSLMYTINDQVNVYATYSKGFKSGVLDSTGFSNTPVNPEKLSNYEVGVKIAADRYRLNASAFYYDYKDKQEQFFKGVTTVLANAANATLYGVDVEGQYQASDKLLLNLGFSYVPEAKYESFPGAVDYKLPQTAFGMTQVSIDASGERMLKAPQFTGNLGANYTDQISLGTLELGGALYYSSSYNWDILKRVVTKSFVTLNAHVGLTPENSNLRVVLFAKNLTNDAHISGAVLDAFADAVEYAPPRLIGIRVEYNLF